MFRMHHTAVLAALYDYTIVQQDKRSGARKKCKAEQEHAEQYRVWPFVTIDGDSTYTYKRVYYDLLRRYEIAPSEDIRPPN